MDNPETLATWATQDTHHKDKYKQNKKAQHRKQDE
jgi:hypothetical protein